MDPFPSADPDARFLFRAGGLALLLALLLAPAEVLIGLLPGVNGILARTVSVTDWFALCGQHWFLALRSLGLLNLAGAFLLVPAVLALWRALRGQGGALLHYGVALCFLGIAVYLASSRALPFLALSRDYAHAATEAERTLLAAAGAALLAEARNRSGLALIELGCLLVSASMLRGRLFPRAAAWTGIAANAAMIAVETLLWIEGRLTPHGMVLAAAGGLLLISWYLLTGLRLLRLGSAQR
ncbi:MAG: hypothetical protein WCE75_14725 [Terracidiphilus sp.]